MPTVSLHAVLSPAQREAARALVTEYLQWVAEVARSNYELSFDITAMAQSDLEDSSKFFPPTGRFYLVHYAGAYIGIGCLKRLSAGIGEIQRMFIQPHVRGVGAGRLLLQRLIEDARSIGYTRVRLESLKALAAAHSLYRSAGFREIDPYSENSMREYQSEETLNAYRRSALFMELSFDVDVDA